MEACLIENQKMKADIRAKNSLLQQHAAHAEDLKKRLNENKEKLKDKEDLLSQNSHR